MGVIELLLKAATLMGLGMTFVFLFLGLLLIAVNFMAKYLPEDVPVVEKRVVQSKPASAISEINPKLVAAITTAVQQYRKSKPV
jgi:oxaloacetate decarboxylase gamma subunit